MALIYPTYDELSEQARAELRRRQPDIDPTIFGSFARPFMDSASALAYSVNLVNRDLSIQLFPQGATGEFLDRWGDYEGLERLPASSAEGDISIEGTASTVIAASTLFNAANGLQYSSTSAAAVQNVSQSISSLTRSGSTVTATTASDHTLATGLSITIAGANEAEYNGTFSITVTGRDTFTYEITTTPSSPATGTITLSGTYASVPLSCVDTGQDTNLDGGATLTLDTPITGVDDSGTAQFDGLSGGADLETDEEFRERILLSRAIIEGVYTADQVKLAALGVAGNTRVFVRTPEISVAVENPSPSDTPSPGQTFVYVLRDNDANIIPTQTVLDNTKQSIIDNGALPANSSELDLSVFAPTTVAVDFTFTTLSPDTVTMRNAITNQLEAFFQDKVNFETDVQEASYLGEIQNTEDLTTGDVVESFTLSAPSGTVTINNGEIAVLGTITYP